jgi:hypothetical protein
MRLNRKLLAVAIGLFAAVPGQAQIYVDYRLTAHLEMGFLDVLSHKIQFSNSGTYFSYTQDGGQDNLFSVSRMSLDLRLSRKHTLIFLYQPLSLDTKNVLAEDLIVDDLTFPAGTPMNFRYDFPFWRVSWLWNLAKDPRDELALGFSFQLRNARIEFASLDGTLFRSNRNVGPVPILKFRGHRGYDSGFWIGAEVDGFYAPISFINGSDNEVVGAILDASVRAGFRLPKNMETFLNIRYLAGGAVGTSEVETGPGDGYVKNWLHFLTITVGLSIGLF